MVFCVTQVPYLFYLRNPGAPESEEPYNTTSLWTRGPAGKIKYQVVSGHVEVYDSQDGWSTVARSEITSEDQSAVTIRALEKSGTKNDIRIRVSWGFDYDNMVEVITWKMTAYSPIMKTAYPTEDLPYGGSTGYTSIHKYRVFYEQADNVAWGGLQVNEEMDLPHHNSIWPNNWEDISPKPGSTTAYGGDPEPGPGYFEDHLRAWGPHNPQCWAPYDEYGNPCSYPNLEVIYYMNQVWRGGSLTSGRGYPMETPKKMSYRIWNARREGSKGN